MVAFLVFLLAPRLSPTVEMIGLDEAGVGTAKPRSLGGTFPCGAKCRDVLLRAALTTEVRR